MRPCAICGNRRPAKTGSRYCEWCDGAINNTPPVRQKKKELRLVPPEETVRGIARLVQEGVLIP